MAFIFLWSMRLLVGLIVLAAAAVGFAYYLASRSLPDYDRSHMLSGVEAPLEIVRDRHAIPHILAESDADAMFGLGFVHAQDRLWQLTMLRRTAQGRLSELFGSETVEIDALMRALDLYGIALAAAERQAPETLALLEAYSEGINAWLTVVQEEALGRGAPEFFLFEGRLAPWVPADSIAVHKLLSLQLSDMAMLETRRARLSLVLPPERLRDVLPDAPNEPILGLPEYSEQFGGTEFAAVEPTDPVPHPLSPVRPPGLAGASNAFAAGSERAAGGAPILANDPHLGFTAPGVWYLARLELETGPVMGGTVPGIPAVLIGRNAELSWGLTSSYLDDQDFYIERLNPDDPTEYLTPDGYRRFETGETVISVRNGENETRSLRWSRHGPVIPGNHFGVEAVTPDGHVASLSWTGLTEDDPTLASLFDVMRAGSIREARDALSEAVTPSVIVTLADGESVALQMAGLAPRRQAGHTSQGRIPAPGWLAVNDWKGYRPFTESPWSLDPPTGIVVNTNNRLTDARFPDHLSHDWGDSYRIERARWLLGARDYHTLDSFIEIQTDAVSEAARLVLPLIGRDLWYADAVAPEGSRDALRQAALARLAEWNGEMSEHQPEPLIYAAWMRALQRRLAIDELGPIVSHVAIPEPVFIERVFRNIDGAEIWCDVVQSTKTETCAEIARIALDDALQELSDRYGDRLDSWRWGDAHQALHLHQTLGRVPVLNLLVNIRQSTPGGDNTLKQGGMPATGPEPYLNVHGAGLRMVVDFADPDSSVFITATGQSGHPLSRHYDDLSALWRRGEYIPMSLDTDLARAGALGVTRLEPAGR